MTTWKASRISMRRPPRMFFTTRPMELETSLTILQNRAACLLHHASYARISFLSSSMHPLCPQLSPPTGYKYPKYPQICHHQKMRKCIRRYPGICHKPASGTALEGVAGAVFDLSAVRRIRFSDGRDEKKRKTKRENVSIRQ